MMRLLILIIIVTFHSCTAQTDAGSTVQFTPDLKSFEGLSGLKETLKDVEIIALGENTHGLGEVFAAKADLVKFLHQELGFSAVLFESGYGDAALAWEQLDSLTPREYTQVFSSNFYYHSEEIESLVGYAKTQNGRLKIQGFDCQPQQDHLIKRMAEVVQPLDSILARSVATEMRGFNNLYQFENDNDTLSFNTQRDQFVRFLNSYNTFLDKHGNDLLQLGVTANEISALRRSNDIFLKTYSTINIGELMGWPTAANFRDKEMLDIVLSYKEENPDSKIIIWAQNSHIENRPKPNDNVKWMGHSLKKSFGNKYYSVGAIVYSGTNQNYSGTFDFAHNHSSYLAYHLNQFQKEKFVLDLRRYPKNDFTSEQLLGMESNGSTAEFIAKDRFDGLLFIRHSDIPTLIR